MTTNTTFKQPDCERMVINCMKSDPWDRRYALEYLVAADFTDIGLRFEFENTIETAKYERIAKPFWEFGYIDYLCRVLKLMTKRREVYMGLHNAMQSLKDWRTNPHEIARKVKICL